MTARSAMVLLFLSCTLAAQSKTETTVSKPDVQASSAVFSLLAGNWSCEGTFNGQPATGDANFVVVNGNLELDYRILRGGKLFFSGKGIYHPRSSKGVWIDAFGNAYVLKLTLTADSLSSQWNDLTTIRGFSTYQVKDGILSLTDEANGKDGRRPFTLFKCKR